MLETTIARTLLYLERVAGRWRLSILSRAPTWGAMLIVMGLVCIWAQVHTGEFVVLISILAICLLLAGAAMIEITFRYRKRHPEMSDEVLESVRQKRDRKAR